MYDLALIVSLVAAAVLLTGPLSIWLAVHQYDLGGLFMAAAALMFGVHWFVNISTPLRFVGLAPMLLGLVAIWYIVRMDRW